MWIMEQPLAISFFGLVIVVGLMGGMFRTGRKWLLYAAILAGLGTAGLLVVERYVTTPQEEVRATLYVIADLLEKNDAPAVMQYISAGRAELREQVRNSMQRVEVLEVRIKRNLTIDVVVSRGAELAEARFNVVARVRGRHEMPDEQLLPRFAVVNLRKEDGQWRVRGYEVHDPRRGI